MSEIVVKQRYRDVEEFSEKDWLDEYENIRTRICAKTSLRIFDFFCENQGFTRDEMIRRYKNWFKPPKDEDGDKPDPDIQSICQSLSKFIKFMSQAHDDIIISTNPQRNNVTTFKKKTPKTTKMYFGFTKGYIRKCHGIRLTMDDIKDFVKIPKIMKEQRQPIILEQLKQIMGNTTPKRRALYYVLISSGMRLGEALTLTKRNFRFQERPVRVVLEAQNTKTYQSRETYVSSECVEKLKQIMGDVINHKEDCACLECDKQFFQSNPNQTLDYNVRYEDHYFVSLRQKIGTKLGQRQSDQKRGFNGEGFFKKYPNSVRYVVNIHSMRAYFITKASQKHSETYAHALAGHGSYLDVYLRIPNDEKRKKYLELEPNLLVESLNVEADLTKDKLMDSMQDHLTKMQEEIARLTKYPQVELLAQ